MSHTPFRFVHASDLHLERPLGGVTEVPDRLREQFLEAPFRAAEKVFDAALNENADFVVLAGDILDATQCGPRGPIFLCEQFRRVEQRGIAVYWAGGPIDGPANWPAGVPLPENVRVFPTDRVEQVVHDRSGLPLCSVCGQSNSHRKFAPGDFRAASSGFTIGVAYGQAEQALLRKVPIAYWALGGKHRAATNTSPRQIVHYPGTPQGRLPQESGPHGCTLVEVDAASHVRTRRISCDALRWQSLEVRVDEHTRRDQLEELLRERLLEQQAAEGRHPVLISWNIVGQGSLWRALRRGGLSQELAHLLRSESAWTVSIAAQPPAEYANAIFEQETLLGDYLRRVRQYQSQPNEPIELSSYVERTKEIPPALWRLKENETRQEVLREAAALGVEILEGDWRADLVNED